MASEDLLALLRSGTRRWNEWRTDNRGAAIGLSEAYLSNVYLPEVNLEGADLTRADPSGAGELWQMLATITRTLPSVVCQPVIQGDEPAPIEDRQPVSGLLALHRYRDVDDLHSVARTLAGRLMPDHKSGEA
jgi:hypothetical protein